jgi:hypothetical protein
MVATCVARSTNTFRLFGQVPNHWVKSPTLFPFNQTVYVPAG